MLANLYKCCVPVFKLYIPLYPALAITDVYCIKHKQLVAV